MAEHPNVPPEMTTAAIQSSPIVLRRYLDAGGSEKDFRTDISHMLAAAGEAARELKTPQYPTWDSHARR